jgi:hypothetical protein
MGLQITYNLDFLKAVAPQLNVMVSVSSQV